VDTFTLPPLVRLLCAEDSADDHELLGIALARADPQHRYELRRVDDVAAFRQALAAPCDAVLCDYNMPKFSPQAALAILASLPGAPPLIVVTRAMGEDAAVSVLRAGAQDYVTKDKLGTLPQVLARVMAVRERAIEKSRLDAELQAAYGRLKELSARLVVAQERERSLISRELHDQLGQSLTAVTIHLNAANRAATREAAQSHAEIANAQAVASLEQLKSLSFALRPPQLDLLGLGAAVHSAIQRMAEPAGLQCRVITRGVEPATLEAHASVVVRLAQEAMTNIARHARATQVVVRLRFLPGDRFGLLVVDNGVGFDRASVLGGRPTERNFGLYGMIERTELAGGRLQILARPGRGVAIRAVL
jgi:signal transduction histidine kinase